MSDFNKLKPFLETYLIQKGINTKKTFNCFNPDHPDKNPSMAFSKKLNICKCFACGKVYDIFNLVGQDYDINDFKLQVEKVVELSGNKKINLDFTQSVNNVNQKEIDYSESFRIWMMSSMNINYFEKRGIGIETISKYKLGYDEERNAIIVPTSNSSYVVRNIDDTASVRYQKIGKNEVYLYEHISSIDKPIFITEGEIDALSIIEAGGFAIALGSVANMNKFINKIKIDRYPNEFLIALDNDDAGIKASKLLKQELNNLGIKNRIVNIYGECKDANELLVKNRKLLKNNILKTVSISHTISKELNKESISEFRLNIVKEFIKVLYEKGLDWKKGWEMNTDLFSPESSNGGKYKGLNRFHLFFTAINNGYKDNRWYTFKQIQEKGYKLENAKGRGVKVEYYFPYDIIEKKYISWQELENLEEKIGNRYKLYSKQFTVFNGDLIKGLPPLNKKLENHKLSEYELKESVLKISNSMGVPINYDGGNRAYYSMLNDDIHVPLPQFFNSEYELNSTILHELGHATGSSKRLDRIKSYNFADEKYAYEELVAEITSCFMAFEIGLEQSTMQIENHKAYVESWIKHLQDKPSMLINAIKEGERATNYLLCHIDRGIEIDKSLEFNFEPENYKKDISINKSINRVKKLNKIRGISI